MSFTIINYTLFNILLKGLKIEKPIMIGHSFGGKITLLYSSMYETEKIILFGSPYTKEVQNPSLKTKILKKMKKVPLVNKLEKFAKKHIGLIISIEMHLK